MQHFLIDIEYRVSRSELGQAREAHLRYLQSAINQGVVLLSATYTSDVGGFLLARADSQASLEAFFALDPYQREGLASYRFRSFQADIHDSMLLDWMGSA